MLPRQSHSIHVSSNSITLSAEMLRRASTIVFYAWNGPPTPPKCNGLKRRIPDPIRFNFYDQSLLDTGKFESRVELPASWWAHGARISEVWNAWGRETATRYRFRQQFQTSSPRTRHSALTARHAEASDCSSMSSCPIARFDAIPAFA